MTEDEVREKVINAIEGSEVTVRDLKGDGRSFRIEVKSSIFEGKTLISQHRLVQDIFAQDLASDTIHALSIATVTC